MVVYPYKGILFSNKRNDQWAGYTSWISLIIVIKSERHWTEKK